MRRVSGTSRARRGRPSPRCGDPVPIYEYECGGCAARFEVLQAVHEPDPGACVDCGSPLVRILSAPRLNTRNFSGPTEARLARTPRSEEIAREQVLQRSYETLRFPPGVKHDPGEGGE